jgi:UDP-N-acetylmuramyl pentapeptide synthase
LDRYGEIDTNVNHIRELLLTFVDCKVILNGNDPNLVRIGSAVKLENCFYFGVKQENTEFSFAIEQSSVTPLKPLDFPQLDLWADAIQTEYLCGSHFTMGYSGAEIDIDLQLPGEFNILNALAAVGVCLTVGIQLDMMKAILGKVRSSYGRSEHFFYRDTSVFMFLVKNPAGFNNIIQLLNQSHNTKRILVLLNDLVADGRDVSWIWDIDLEKLWKVNGIKEITASGTRAGDMALLLKYSYPPDIPLSVDYFPKRAFKKLIKRLKGNEELLVLANYNAMIGFRPFLLKICKSQN